jgi:tetratricopeptide (TPR) repeat protein
MRTTTVTRLIALALLLADTGCAARGRALAPGALPQAHAATAREGRAKRGDPVPSRTADTLEEARRGALEQPGEPWWPTRVAEIEDLAGHPAEAEAALREALVRDSAYAPALTRLSRLLYAQGRHAEAVALLEPVREHRVPLAPADRAAALAGLALHEAALGRDAEARGALALLARDERDGATGVAAYLAVRGTALDSALAATERAVRTAPGSAAQQNNRGIALLRSGDVDGAQLAFERAIALDAGLPGPYYNLAILERFYRLDTAAAERRFRDYWTRSHADPDSLFTELGRPRSTNVAEGGAGR